MANMISIHYRKLFFSFVLTFLWALPLWQAQGQADNTYIGAISWSPDGSSIAVINTVPVGSSCDEVDKKIRIIQVETFETGEIVTNDCTLASVSFSSSGEKLATASLSGFVKIWSVTDKNLVTYMDILQKVSKVQWHPDDETKLLMQTDYSVKLRNPKANFLDGEGAFIVSRTNSTIDLTTTDSDWNFSSDKVVTSTSDGKIYVWDALIRDSVIRIFDQHPVKVNAVAWSPNYASNLIASGDESGTILIWSVANGQVIKTITDHTGAINDLEWSPDGKNLASASSDGTVKVWAVSTGTEQASFDYGAPVHAVAWKPGLDENIIAFGGESVSGAKGVVEFQTLSLTSLGLPLASAGPDQIIAGDGISVEVILDGSGSADPDSTITTYVWSENNRVIATGVNPVLNLGVGVHMLTLTVTDDDNQSATDEVVITILAETATYTPSATPTATDTATNTATYTTTFTPTFTPSFTYPPTFTLTPTRTPTN